MRQDNTTLLFGKGHLGGFILKKNPEISWTQRKDSQGKLFFELENYENFSLPTQIKTIIWTIPPHTMTVPFLTKLPRNIQIIFISSTSVFSKGLIKNDTVLDPRTSNGKLLEAAETHIKKHFKKYVIIRPGGLVDQTRHPKNFFNNASKMNNANHHPNLIHTEDVARFVILLFKSDSIWNHCYNLVATINLNKKEFYGKYISNKKFKFIESHSEEKFFEMNWKKEIGFTLKYPDLDEYFK